MAEAISIHAPLAGCDPRSPLMFLTELYFNPRTPCGVRRELEGVIEKKTGISIHAPLAGCDSLSCSKNWCLTNFNPRTPCGVRRRQCWRNGTRKAFQSTHPLRGATLVLTASFITSAISIHAPLAGCDMERRRLGFRISISIHAPLAGCDLKTAQKKYRTKNFNPRTPCGVRRYFSIRLQPTPEFQSTHPLRGATLYRVQLLYGRFISIHAPLAGCDPPAY